MWYDGIEDRAVAAYKEHGLKAVAGQFAPTEQNAACCALGAITLGKSRTGLWARDWAEVLQTTEQEVWDFIYGFDSEMNLQASDGRSNQVRAAGIRTAKRVKAEGLAA